MKLGSLNINIPQSHYDRFDEKSRSRKNKVHVFHGYRDDSVSFQPTPARLRPEPQAEPPTEDATLKELEVEGEVIQLPQNPDVASCKPPSCDEVEDVITAADGEGTEEETDGKPRRKNDAKFKCQYCDRIFNSPSARLHHTKSKHVGVKYDCNQCDKHFTHQSSLTTHIQSTHEGVKYACNQCDYQATQKSHLTRHMKSKHM